MNFEIRKIKEDNNYIWHIYFHSLFQVSGFFGVNFSEDWGVWLYFD